MEALSSRRSPRCGRRGSCSTSQWAVCRRSFTNATIGIEKKGRGSISRYLKRGVNEEGKVANDVEIEQIVYEEMLRQRQISSVVQNRGLIPLFWSQQTSKLNLKPDIIFSQGPRAEDVLNFGALLKESCTSHMCDDTKKCANVSYIDDLDDISLEDTFCSSDPGNGVAEAEVNEKNIIGSVIDTVAVIDILEEYTVLSAR